MLLQEVMKFLLSWTRLRGYTLYLPYHRLFSFTKWLNQIGNTVLQQYYEGIKCVTYLLPTFVMRTGQFKGWSMSQTRIRGDTLFFNFDGNALVLSAN